MAPDKYHPQSNKEAQEAFKKLPKLLEEARNDKPERPIHLMFQDEVRFGRINDIRKSWAPKPMPPICKAMITHEYTYSISDEQLGGE